MISSDGDQVILQADLLLESTTTAIPANERYQYSSEKHKNTALSHSITL
jgi:hypothetical protein